MRDMLWIRFTRQTRGFALDHAVMISRAEMQAVGDIVVGSVLGPSSQRANEARIAMFLAGFPETVPVRTVNRRATASSSTMSMPCSLRICSASSPTAW